MRLHERTDETLAQVRLRVFCSFDGAMGLEDELEHVADSNYYEQVQSCDHSIRGWNSWFHDG